MAADLPPCSRRQRRGCDRALRGKYGFTYIGLLLAVAIAGTLLAAAGVLWRTDAVREREAELLFIGGEMQRALESYFQATPQEPRRYPKSLDDLLEDRRGPVVRRHLRRLYVDPFTGKPDWMLVRAADGSVIGVHSAAEGAPIRRASPFGPFPFPDAKSYRDWVFRPRSDAQRAADAPAGGAAVPGAAPAVGTPIIAPGFAPK
jgi:type II secretory pathway pseudopilin PulG